MKNFLLFIKVPIILSVALIIGNVSLAQKTKGLIPHLANVPYGTHERNVFDIWFADTTKQSPLVLYIHGGGFVSGSKDKLSPRVVEEFLASGISVAAINYRFLAHAPLPAAHDDVRRALQFIRSRAEEWNIDKSKIGAFGGSAGAQLCMWLAFSDDMANPDAKDPVERESSRLYCVATNGGQTTMDSSLWKQWLPEFDRYGTTQNQFYGKLTHDERMKIIEKISAINIVSSDDPPIYMTYGMKPGDPVPQGKAMGWKIHHVNFGIKLKEKMDELGVEADLGYPDAETRYQSRFEFLCAKLLK